MACPLSARADKKRTTEPDERVAWSVTRGMLRYVPEAKFRLVGLFRQGGEPRPLRAGAPDQRALQIIAAPLLQELGGALVLHPFRNRREIELLAQFHERAHKSAVVIRAQHILHKSTVDLDDIDAELA